jgi:transposase
MNILAMDLGKSKTVFCDYDSETAKYEFGKIETAPKQMHDLIVEKSPDRVVIEICSSSGWVYDIIKLLGIEVEVANPNHQAWRWKNVKRKNDREDALKLAQLSAMHQLPTVHMPTLEVRQQRSLIQYRQRLVKRRTQIKNNIRSILDKEGLRLVSGDSVWSKKSLLLLRQKSLPIEGCGFEDLWRGQLCVELDMLESTEKCIGQVTSKLDSICKTDSKIKRLVTVPGVGSRLAETIVAFLDEPGRFASGKQVGSYAGLTPKQYQSGSMDRQGRISGQGNKLLRSLLVEVSWLGLRHNRWMRETYERLLRGSDSRKKIAITAVARKLLVKCWAMLRDEQDWRDIEPDKEKAAA